MENKIDWKKKIYLIQKGYVIPCSFLMDYKWGYAFYLNEISMKPIRIHLNHTYFDNKIDAIKEIIKGHELCIKHLKDDIKVIMKNEKNNKNN